MVYLDRGISGSDDREENEACKKEKMVYAV